MPRSARGNVGSIGQNLDVAQQMADKMLDCNIDEFLHYYAPFCPTDDWIDYCAWKIETWQIFNERWMARWRWDSFQIWRIRGSCFFGGGKLKPIVKALTAKKVLWHRQQGPLRKCNFSHEDCGDYTEWLGRLQEAYFSLTSFPSRYIRPRRSWYRKWQSQQSLRRKGKDFHDVRTQILMYPDIGIQVSLCVEGWMVIFIQITIEGEAMAVGYFSCSHSVVSKPFDFTQISIGSLHAPLD